MLREPAPPPLPAALSIWPCVAVEDRGGGLLRLPGRRGSEGFVGLVIAGQAALKLGGFLANQGRVSVVVMALVAATGAIAGDSIGYELGRTVGQPFASQPDRSARR